MQYTTLEMVNEITCDVTKRFMSVNVAGEVLFARHSFGKAGIILENDGELLKMSAKNLSVIWKEAVDVVDWSNVPVDTKIEIWDGQEWLPRHFAKYNKESDIVFAWEYGLTSWSSNLMISCEKARLLNEG